MIITDIHMHIIPNVDDGSPGLEESISMLQMSAGQGVGTVIATPHSWGIEHYGIEHVLSRFELLKKAVTARKIPIHLYLGCEMLVKMKYDPSWMYLDGKGFPYGDTVDDCIRKLENCGYPTMAGTRYVLTEFDEQEEEENMGPCIQKLVCAGYIPIIAHAERYRKITMTIVRELKAYGAKIQINAYSIANEKRDKTRQLANGCLSEKLVDFIGSDAHRLDHRPPIISDGVDAMIQLYTEEYARKVLEDNPRDLFLRI